jgi:hypothetical protein
MLKSLKTAATECPGVTGLVAYAVLSFIACCLYWQFGLNDWVKIGLCPLWILTVAGGMNVALAIDVR